MANLVGYGTGRIQAMSNSRPTHEYSDRSVIQLVETDFPNAVLRAHDVVNNNQLIFEIPLQNKDQYRFGNFEDDPDEVQSDDGIYLLWLNELSYIKFHQDIRNHFEQLDLMNPSNNSPPKPSRTNVSVSNNRTTDIRLDYDRVQSDEPVRTIPSIVSPKDLLLDVNLLNQSIEQGDGNKAARIASQLASHSVSLAAKSLNHVRNEKEFTIQVQLDGNEYSVDQYGARIPVNVFQSTTTRELRAVFELAYSYPPNSQYFFVNGRLAYDYSTMKDLNVGPNSLFILFVLTHPKKIIRNPWKCPHCGVNNQANNLICNSCSARP